MPSPLLSVRRSTRLGNSRSSPALSRFVPAASPTKSCPPAPIVAMMGCFTSGGPAATSATSPSGRSIGGEAAKRRKVERLQLRSKAKVQHAEQGFMHAILQKGGTKSSRERPCLITTRKSRRRAHGRRRLSKGLLRNAKAKPPRGRVKIRAPARVKFAMTETGRLVTSNTTLNEQNAQMLFPMNRRFVERSKKGTQHDTI